MKQSYFLILLLISAFGYSQITLGTTKRKAVVCPMGFTYDKVKATCVSKEDYQHTVSDSILVENSSTEIDTIQKIDTKQDTDKLAEQKKAALEKEKLLNIEIEKTRRLAEEEARLKAEKIAKEQADLKSKQEEEKAAKLAEEKAKAIKIAEVEAKLKAEKIAKEQADLKRKQEEEKAAKLAEEKAKAIKLAETEAQLKKENLSSQNKSKSNSATKNSSTQDYSDDIAFLKKEIEELKREIKILRVQGTTANNDYLKTITQNGVISQSFSNGETITIDAKNIECPADYIWYEDLNICLLKATYTKILATNIVPQTFSPIDVKCPKYFLWNGSENGCKPTASFQNNK